MVQMSWRIRSACAAALCLALSCGAPSARAVTSEEANTLFEAHTKAFYRYE